MDIYVIYFEEQIHWVHAPEVTQLKSHHKIGLSNTIVLKQINGFPKSSVKKDIHKERWSDLKFLS